MRWGRCGYHGDAAGAANNLNRIWRLIAEAFVKVPSDSDKVFFQAGMGVDIVPFDHAAIAAFRTKDRICKIVRIAAETCGQRHLLFCGSAGSVLEAVPEVSMRQNAG